MKKRTSLCVEQSMEQSRALIAAGLLTCVFILAGCGGNSSSSNHVASLPTTTNDAAVASANAPKPFHPTKDPYKAAVQYVNCMRDHGIDLPDPDAKGNIHLTPADEKRIGPPGRKSNAADAACFHFLRGAVNTSPLSDLAKSRMADVLLDFSRCMRKRGWELGDPLVENLSRGRVRMSFPAESNEVRGASSSGSPNHAKYMADQTRCERGQAARLDKAIGNER